MLRREPKPKSVESTKLNAPARVRSFMSLTLSELWRGISSTVRTIRFSNFAFFSLLFKIELAPSPSSLGFLLNSSKSTYSSLYMTCIGVGVGDGDAQFVVMSRLQPPLTLPPAPPLSLRVYNFHTPFGF